MNLLVLILTSWLAQADQAHGAISPYAFGDVPARFHSLELSTGARALGDLCLSRESMPDGTVCNPAFLPYYPESSLMARVYVGNGYEAVSTADQFLNQKITREFLTDFFQKNNATGLEVNAGLFFTTRYFSATFSPYRVQYFSEGHNPNFPVMAVHAANERSISLAGGYPLTALNPKLKDFTVGGKLRILERTFVHGSFSLFQAQADDAKNFLPVQDQNAVLLDTFAGWVAPKSRWPMRASVSIKNIGAAWPASDLYPEYTDLELGYGVEPPVPLGKLSLGLDLVDLFRAEDFGSRFRFGTSYRIGVLELMTGINSYAWSAGLQFSFQVVKAGIVYELVQGDLKGGRSPEDKVATEIALHI
jgi:hypothetical protein